MAWREKNKISYFGKKEIEKRQPTVQVPKLYEKKYCSGSKPTHPDINTLSAQLSSGGRMWWKRCIRGMLAFVVTADGLVFWGSFKTTIRTPLKEAILYQMCTFNWDNFYTPEIMHFNLCGRVYYHTFLLLYVHFLTAALFQWKKKKECQ